MISQHSPAIPGEDTTRQAKFGGIGSLHNLLLRVKWQDGHDRPKDLFLHTRHVILAVPWKHGRAQVLQMEEQQHSLCIQQPTQPWRQHPALHSLLEEQPGTPCISKAPTASFLSGPPTAQISLDAVLGSLSASIQVAVHAGDITEPGYTELSIPRRNSTTPIVP